MKNFFKYLVKSIIRENTASAKSNNSKSNLNLNLDTYTNVSINSMSYYDDDVEQLCGLFRRVQCEPFGGRAVPVPLKRVSVRADVADFVAEITVTQEYVNRDEDPIEAEYLFPVESDAAVVHFEAEVDGRKIEAVLKERQEARKDYDEAVADDRTAFLLEETKADVFKIKVGHLKPGAGAKIVLRYVSELPAEEGSARMTVPTTIAPRYTPPQYHPYYGHDEKAKDEAIAALAKIKYQWETPAPMEVVVNVRSTTELESVTSPSHKFKFVKTSDRETKATLEGVVTDMDRDVLVLVRAKDLHRPRAVLEEWKEKGTRAGMVSLVPSFNLREQPVELVFLVDRSGSMTGSGIDQAKSALQLFLHSMPSECLFNIVSFGSSHSVLFADGSRPYDDDTLGEAKAHVAGMRADMGGTEIHDPLLMILMKTPKEGYMRQVFVLTDGSVSNDEQVMAMVRKNSGEGNGRVFALGLGNGCSRHLVKGVAKAGQGTAAFAADGEDLRPRVMSQLKNALQPAIKDVRVEWIGCEEDKSGGDLAKLVRDGEADQDRLLLGQAPARQPPVYDGSRLLSYRLFAADEVPRSVRVTAKTPGDGELSVEVDVVEADFLKERLVHQLAARKRMQDLEQEKKDLEPEQETVDYQKLEESLPKIDYSVQGPNAPDTFCKVIDEKLEAELKAYCDFEEARRKRQQEIMEMRQEKMEEMQKEIEARRIKKLEESKPAREKVDAALVEIGVNYNLASSATSFVAVDPREKKEGQEFGQMKKVEVPNQVPSGYGGFQAMASRQHRGPMMGGGGRQMRLSRGAAAPVAYACAGPPMMMQQQQLCSLPPPPAASSFSPQTHSSRLDFSAESFSMKARSFGGTKKMMKAKKFSKFEADCDDLDEAGTADDAAGGGDPLTEVIDLQGSSGVFRWGAALERILGKGRDEVVAEKPEGCSEEVWLTLLVLEWLETEQKAQEELWELVAGKGRKFAKTNQKEGLEEAEKQAKKVLKEMMTKK